MKSLIYTLIIGLLIAAGSFYYFIYRKEAAPEPEPVAQTEQVEEVVEEPDEFNKSEYSIDDPASIWLVVNKQRPIPLDYVPENLVKVEVKEKNRDKSEDELSMRQDAAKALESLFAAASSDGIDLLLGSGYRSADLQNFYYTNYVSAYGQAEADKFSAKPGTSEHQTGLTADVSGVDRTCYLETCFANTPEGEWVKANAHDFGFIIRYEEGKEGITGYQFEPWHLRFVGQKLAKELNRTSQNMEEFFSLTGTP